MSSNIGAPTWVERPPEVLVQIGRVIEMMPVPALVIICLWRPDGAFQITGTERPGVRAHFDKLMRIAPADQKSKVLDGIEAAVGSVPPDMIPFIECKAGKMPEFGALSAAAAKEDAARAAMQIASASKKDGGSRLPS